MAMLPFMEAGVVALVMVSLLSDITCNRAKDTCFYVLNHCGSSRPDFLLKISTLLPVLNPKCPKSNTKMGVSE